MKNLDQIFVGINRISEAGPKDQFWPVVFMSGCNLRCPYCLNADIVDVDKVFSYIPIDRIIEQLDEWGEEGVMISGGEPCMPRSCDIVTICQSLRTQERKIGVATNGTNPAALTDLLLKNDIVSYIALDVKFSPMDTQSNEKSLIISNNATISDKILQSLMIVERWHARFQDRVASEIRTTLYPPLIDAKGLRAIARLVPKASTWVLQQYRKNAAFASGAPIEPYSETMVSELYAVAQKECNIKVEMRWP